METSGTVVVSWNFAHGAKISGVLLVGTLENGQHKLINAYSGEEAAIVRDRLIENCVTKSRFFKNREKKKQMQADSVVVSWDSNVYDVFVLCIGKRDKKTNEIDIIKAFNGFEAEKIRDILIPWRKIKKMEVDNNDITRR